MRQIASWLSAMRRTRRWFAVDVGSSAIKIAEVTERGGAPEVLRAAALPVPFGAVENSVVRDTAALTRAIRAFAAPVGRDRPPVVAAVPGRSVFIKRLQLPAHPTEALDDVIEFEAMEAVPEDLGNVNLDYHLLGPSEDGSGREALLVAARKSLIENHVRFLESAGLTPAIVDVDHFALHRVCGDPSCDGDAPSAWINVGARSTTIHLPAPDGPGYTTDLPAGGALFTERLAEKLGVSRDEAETIKCGRPATAGGDLLDSLCDSLAAQVGRAINLFDPMGGGAGAGPRRIVLSGGGALLPGLGPSLARALDADVRTGGPFFNRTASTGPGSDGPVFAVVAGLAARNPFESADDRGEDAVP